MSALQCLFIADAYTNIAALRASLAVWTHRTILRSDKEALCQHKKKRGSRSLSQQVDEFDISRNDHKFSTYLTMMINYIIQHLVTQHIIYICLVTSVPPPGCCLASSHRAHLLVKVARTHGLLQLAINTCYSRMLSFMIHIVCPISCGWGHLYNNTVMIMTRLSCTYHRSSS